MKYCDQCGRPLKDEANFCDFCGRECKKPSAYSKASNKNHMPPKKRAFKRFIAAVVVISVICTAAVAFFWNKSKIFPVNSAEKAISPSEKSGERLGYENAPDNLDTCTDYGKGKLLRQVNTYENDALNCITVFSYNEKGLIMEVTDHYYGEEYRYSKSISTFAYDSADRVIESRLYLGSAKEYSESTEYIYNDKGQLASVHRKDTHGEGIITYEYDAQGKLVRAVSEDENSRTVFLYDEDGNVLESTTYYNDGQTYTVKETHRTRIIYDGEYRPFIIRATEVINTGVVEAVFAHIEDGMGTAIYELPLENPELTADGDGYLVKVKDEWQYSGIVRTYLFYYDGDKLPQDAVETPTEPQDAGNEPQKKIGKLEYPISEEDAYIIFRNYFSEFDEEDITVEISRMGKGDSEMLFFDIKMEFFIWKPPMTWGFFNVYVNTGRCTGGAQGHEDSWPVFQAEDYYY